MYFFPSSPRGKEQKVIKCLFFSFCGKDTFKTLSSLSAQTPLFPPLDEHDTLSGKQHSIACRCVPLFPDSRPGDTFNTFLTLSDILHRRDGCLGASIHRGIGHAVSFSVLFFCETLLGQTEIFLAESTLCGGILVL